MVEKAEGPDRAFFWGTDFSTQGYMKWTLSQKTAETLLSSVRVGLDFEFKSLIYITFGITFTGLTH